MGFLNVLNFFFNSLVCVSDIRSYLLAKHLKPILKKYKAKHNGICSVNQNQISIDLGGKISLRNYGVAATSKKIDMTQTSFTILLYVSMIFVLTSYKAKHKVNSVNTEPNQLKIALIN